MEETARSEQPVCCSVSVRHFHTVDFTYVTISESSAILFMGESLVSGTGL
jgi:hypothetical protein